MKISVIIPAYNVEKYIERSINSILKQTYKPFEIIIVDDGSTDNTANIIKGYGGRVNYYYNENGGQSSARNYGILKAKGDWIAWLDADDEWRENHLINFNKVLSKNEKLYWYGAPANSYDDITGELIHEFRKKRNKLVDGTYFKDYMSALPPNAFFCHNTIIIHKDVYKKVGLYDITKINAADLDLYFRIGLHFPKIAYCYEVAANIYRRKSSVSFKVDKPIAITIKRFKDCEGMALALGQSYSDRARPRINYWVVKLLKSSIKKNDIEALKEIKSHFGYILPFQYKLLIESVLKFPFLIKNIN